MPKIQLRRGTAAQWTSANTVLAAGEVGVETDTLKIKVGNGSTAWTSLAYVSGSGGSGSVTAANITDATTIGRTVLTAADAAAVRTAIGAGTGTSNLVIGTTSTTAKAGNYTPTSSEIVAALGYTPATSSGSGGPIASTDITDSTTVGRSVLTAASASAARTAIGAGTSSLALGTTSSTAKAGDYQPTAANISDSTAVGRSVLTAADAAAARTAIGAGTSNLAVGTTASDAKAGNYTPTSSEIVTALGFTPAADAGSSDAQFFNWKSSNTRKLAASLAKCVAGTGYSDHLFIGDSITCNTTNNAGSTATGSWAYMWPRVMRRILTTQGVIPQAGGWVLGGTISSLYDPRWTRTGAWTSGASGVATITASGATLLFTSDLPGTIAQVAYLGNSAAFTVSIDGGSAVTVTPSGTSTQVQFYTVTGLANTTHTILITTTSASVATSINAADVKADYGLRITNVAHGGRTTASYAADLGAANASYANKLLASPDVVHVMLGTNDINGSVSDSTYATNLTTIRNAFPNADCFLWVPPKSSGFDTQWAAYQAAAKSVATTLNIPLIDITARWGGYTVAYNNGLMGASDTLHATIPGQADIGRLAASLINKTM